MNWQATFTFLTWGFGITAVLNLAIAFVAGANSSPKPFLYIAGVLTLLTLACGSLAAGLM